MSEKLTFSMIKTAAKYTSTDAPKYLQLLFQSTTPPKKYRPLHETLKCNPKRIRTDFLYLVTYPAVSVLLLKHAVRSVGQLTMIVSIQTTHNLVMASTVFYCCAGC